MAAPTLACLARELPSRRGRGVIRCDGDLVPAKGHGRDDTSEPRLHEREAAFSQKSIRQPTAAAPVESRSAQSASSGRAAVEVVGAGAYPGWVDVLFIGAEGRARPHAAR